MNFKDYFKSLFGSDPEASDAAMKELKDYIDGLKNGDVNDDSSAEESPDVMTDEEIQNKAERELEEPYLDKKENIIDEYREKLEKKQKDAEETRRSLDSSLKTLMENRNKYLAENHKDSLKRGIARSSINLNTEKEINDAAAEEANEIGSVYGRKLDDVNTELKNLESKRQTALDKLNIAYAADLAAKMKELAEEREKILERAEKDRENNKEENEERTNKEYFKRVYEKANEILAKMAPADARKALLNDEVFKENLNDYYYYLLYKRYAS